MCACFLFFGVVVYFFITADNDVDVRVLILCV